MQGARGPGVLGAALEGQAGGPVPSWAVFPSTLSCLQVPLFSAQKGADHHPRA